METASATARKTSRYDQLTAAWSRWSAVSFEAGKTYFKLSHYDN